MSWEVEHWPIPPLYNPGGFKLFSWGYNGTPGSMGIGFTYQFGNPAYQNYKFSSPVQIGSLRSWTQLGVGYYAALAVRADGRAFAWGQNHPWGILGLGDTTYHFAPTQIGAQTGWTKLSVGTMRSNGCGVLNGKFYVWGHNTYGGLGNGTLTPTAVSSPVQLGAAADWTDCHVTSNCLHGIRAGGQLWGWGENDWGQIGVPGRAGTPLYGYSSPVQVGALTWWSKLIPGINLSLGCLTTQGYLFVWGQDSSGQLGKPATPVHGYTASPIQMGVGKTWVDGAFGYDHFIGVTTDGKLWAAGDGNRGQLGQNNTNSYSSIVQVGSGTNWTRCAAGKFWSAAVDSTGRLWTWGNNGSGQLAQGDIVDRSLPTQVGRLTNWTGVAAMAFTCFGFAK